MKLHIVGGFLGSGKTTAIAAHAKRLVGAGLKVGVVTNDQGKYLVDTAFFEMADVPTVEVTGGCFCCNYDDLEERLAALQAAAQPDVIFAESVGSCADVVATVVKPLLTLGRGGISPSSFSVFADARLLRQRLLGLPMPFSDDVVYIFDKQIEEAGLLVVNKMDLLSTSAVVEILTLARQAYPDKHTIAQNSLDEASLQPWIDLLATESLAGQSVDIDYQRYGAGEAELAWLDEVVTLTVSPDEGRPSVIALLTEFVNAIQAQHWAIGHLKFIVSDGQSRTKISFPTLDAPEWQSQVPPLSGATLTLLINARVAAPAEDLTRLVHQTLETTREALDFGYHVDQQASFHPGYPTPTHRL